MADQGKTLITMTVPSTGTRGELISGAGTLSATLRAVGVLYDDADGATKGPVQTAGTALVVLGATLTAGADVQSDANGAAIAAVDDGLVCGVLLEGGISGDLRNMIIK